MDELDKTKKGTDSINLRTRQVIRYLDRQTKTRPSKSIGNVPPGVLRIQSPEDMFSKWDDCEKYRNKPDGEASKEISRYFRGIINFVLFMRSKGNDLLIVTEDAGLVSVAEEWGINTLTVESMDNASSKAVEDYARRFKEYETRKLNAGRSRPTKGTKLWAPMKENQY